MKHGMDMKSGFHFRFSGFPSDLVHCYCYLLRLFMFPKNKNTKNKANIFMSNNYEMMRQAQNSSNQVVYKFDEMLIHILKRVKLNTYTTNTLRKSKFKRKRGKNGKL